VAGAAAAARTTALDVHAEGEQVVLVPGHLGPADPEGAKLDVVRRPFAGRPPLFRGGAAIVKWPDGIATISKLTLVPGMVSV
jgi:hypothetical protein